MNKSTKLFIMLVSITMFTTLFAVSTFAEVYTGSCGAEGDNVTYTLDTETGVFELSGTGKMADYYQKTTPWYYQMDIMRIATFMLLMLLKQLMIS